MVKDREKYWYWSKHFAEGIIKTERRKFVSPIWI
jgi:hypothetical protein